MMTMHSAKGLEFPVVFVVGTEEGIFPGIRAIGETDEMEEERRLCYVAMTRAKEKLYMTCAGQRMLFGRTSSNRPSRFVGEIPEELVEKKGRSFLSQDSDWGGIPSRDSGYNGYGDRPSYGQRRSEFDQRPQSSYGGFTRAMSGSAAGGNARPAGTGRTVERSRMPLPQTGGMGSAPAAAPSLTAFQKGDMVQHKAFGKGMVLSVQKMGGDALLEIAFDNVGTKRLMLKSAAAHMQKV